MVNVLFYYFLFLLPLQTVYFLREPFIGGVKWEYGVIGVYATDLLLLLLVVWFLLNFFFFKKYQISNIKYQILDKILVLFLLWTGLSIFWAGDQMLALYFFVKLLLAVGLFFVVREMEIDIKRLVFVLLAVGVVQSGIGVAQFLYQYSPEASILGISSHEAFQAGSSVLKIDSGRFLRAYGTFPHPNILGGFLGVVLIMSIAYYVFRLTYKREWSTFFEILFLLVGILIVFLGLVLTFSRSTWLGVLLGIFVVGLYAFRQKDSWVRGRFLKILFALLLSGFVFGLVLHEQIVPRFDTVTIEREGSISERVTSLQDARELIEKNLFIGVGAGNFTAEMIDQNPDRPVWNIQPAHNVFLLVWSELGIIGFALIFAFFGALFFQIQKENLIFGGAFLVLIPSLFLDHFLWTSHFGLLFFFLLLGFVMRR